MAYDGIMMHQVKNLLIGLKKSVDRRYFIVYSEKDDSPMEHTPKI